MTTNAEVLHDEREGHDVVDHPRDAPWNVVRPPALGWFLRAAVIVAVLDVLLAFALPGDPLAGTALEPLAGRSDLRHVLQRADEAKAWVLIGDSVLAGDVLRQHDDAWATERVVDHVRRQIGDGSRFEQVALNGVLLDDVLGVIAELDAIDPDGSVPVAIEINPRYFSRHYSKRRSCAHEWLCDRSRVEQGGLPNLWARAGLVVDDALDRARGWIPVLRHRRSVTPALEPQQWLSSTERTPDAVAGRARILEHYARPKFTKGSKSMEALAEIVERLRATDREAVFFMTPLNDEFLVGTTDVERLGKLSAWISHAIHPDHRRRLVELDHPLFRPDHFVDHCHLTADGNRLLAQNLLWGLGLPLGHVPHREEMAHPAGADRVMVARRRLGDSDGPPWAATFSAVSGVTVGPDGLVVIADQGSSTLRAIEPGGHTVRTLARGREAGMSGVSSPAFAGTELYALVESGEGIALIERARGELVIDLAERGLTATDLVPMPDGRLLVVGPNQINVFEPGRASLDTLVTTRARRRIKHATVGGGRVFVVDERSRIISFPLDDRPRTLGRAVTPADGEVVFANAGRRLARKRKARNSAYFPMPLDGMRVSEIVGIAWVERYEGLFVRTVDHGTRKGAATRKPRATGPGNVHWRFFDPASGLAYPWVRPRPYGSSYLTWDAKNRRFASTHHAASVYVDPETAMVVEAEHGRSFVIQYADGLRGTAKIGHPTGTAKWMPTGLSDVFASRTGSHAAARYDVVSAPKVPSVLTPLEHGPYNVLVVGTSMLAMSDQVGMYSLGRVIERELAQRLAYRDRTRVEVFQRVQAAAAFPAIVDLSETAAAHVAPDIIVLDFFEPGGTRDSHRDRAKFDQARAKMLALAARYDAHLIVVDSSGLSGGRRTSGFVEDRLAEFERAGVEVIRPGALYLSDRSRLGTVNPPPFRSGHATPWMIDAAGARIAQLIEPSVRRALAGRTPTAERDQSMLQTSAGPTFAEARPDVAKLEWAGLPTMTTADIVQVRNGTHIHALVDLKGRPQTSEAGFRDLAVAAALVLLADPITDTAQTMKISIAEFSRYDEYGQGALEGATIRFEAEYDAAEIAETLAGL